MPVQLRIQKANNRNMSVDVYRLLAMFGICFLHAITQGGLFRGGMDKVVSAWMCSCVGGAVVLGPSMFSIYLLHNSQYGFQFLGIMEGMVIKKFSSHWLAYFLAALVVFILGLAIDFMRRAVAYRLFKGR